jgi:membrane protease YdiL (CAAX protease family)
MKRWLELIALYGLLPALCILRIIPVHIIAVLVVICICCVVVLFNDRAFDRSLLRLSVPDGFRSSLAALLPAYAFASVALSAAVWAFHRDYFFYLPRHAPAFWLLIMVLYPLISVVPQEIIYRVYFFHRFEKLLPRRSIAIAVCALIFGLHHLVFHNWVAVVLTLAGGVKFALTYERTRSLLVVCIEHALYGGLLFTIGLGHFFASGSYNFAARLIPGHP